MSSEYKRGFDEGYEQIETEETDKLNEKLAAQEKAIRESLLKQGEDILLEWSTFEKPVDYKILDWCQKLLDALKTEPGRGTC